MYIVPSDAIASQITNIPQPASGKLINIWSGNTDVYLKQIYSTTSSLTRMYVRTKSDNSWTAWQRLWAMQAAENTGTVTTSAAGTAAFNTTYNTNEWACISVFTTAAVVGCILTPYKYGDAANGRWGFRATGSNGSALANTSISYVAIFIRYVDML